MEIPSWLNYEAEHTGINKIHNKIESFREIFANVFHNS